MEWWSRRQANQLVKVAKTKESHKFGYERINHILFRLTITKKANKMPKQKRGLTTTKIDIK